MRWLMGVGTAAFVALYLSAPGPPAGAVATRPAGVLLVDIDRSAFLNSPLGEPPYVISADGNVLKSLPQLPGLGSAESATDGAFASLETIDPKRTVLRVADTRGVVRSLLLRTRSSLGSLAWSSDGRFLVAADAGVGVHATPMLLVEVRRGRPRLIRTLSLGTDPSWSPNNRWVLSRVGSELYVEMANAGVRQQVAPEASDYAWGADSRHVLFERPTRAPQGRASDLVLADIDGDRARVLLRNLPLSGFSWQPHGDLIAFVSNGELWSMSSTGSRLKRLAPSLGVTSGDPIWSPDGRGLAVTANGDVWVVAARPGSRPRRLTQGWRYGYSPRALQWLASGIDGMPGKVVSPAVPTDTVVTADELRTSAPVAQLAADGERLVVGFGDNWFVNRPEPYRTTTRNCLELWNHAARKTTVIVGGDPCTLDTHRQRGAGAHGLQSLAVAGARVAFAKFRYFSGIDRFALTTLTEGLPAGRNVEGLACPEGSAPSCYSEPKVDLQGDGDLLVFDTWRCTNPYDVCEFLPKRNGRLWRIVGTEARLVAQGAGPMTPLSVDAGRILVDRGTDGYAVLDRQGAVLARFDLNREVVQGARLEGADLVVLTPLGLEVSDAGTGTFLDRWPLPAKDLRLVDLERGIAVLEGAAGVVLIRVSDGNAVTLEVAGRKVQHAQIEPEGLFYSYVVDDPEQRGRVRFEPMDETLSRFG